MIDYCLFLPPPPPPTPLFYMQIIVLNVTFLVFAEELVVFAGYLRAEIFLAAIRRKRI